MFHRRAAAQQEARLAEFESSIYAIDRLRHADLYSDVETTLRNQLIDCHTPEQNAKQLNNLSIQEGRLRRQVCQRPFRAESPLQSPASSAGSRPPAGANKTTSSISRRRDRLEHAK